jgi:hypothetical protein
MAPQIAAEMSKPREAVEHWLLIIMLLGRHRGGACDQASSTLQRASGSL